METPKMYERELQVPKGPKPNFELKSKLALVAKFAYTHESTISSCISLGAISPGIDSMRCRSLSLWAAASSA